MVKPYWATSMVSILPSKVWTIVELSSVCDHHLLLGYYSVWLICALYMGFRLVFTPNLYLL